MGDHRKEENGYLRNDREYMRRMRQKDTWHIRRHTYSRRDIYFAHIQDRVGHTVPFQQSNGASLSRMRHFPDGTVCHAP